MRVLWGILVLILAASVSRAQQAEGPRRPELASRIVRVYDFEERSYNTSSLPSHWYRNLDDPQGGLARPGYPIWNQAALDYTVAAEGGASARLIAHTGSGAIRLKPNVLPILPDVDYLVSALVMTRGVEHARAVLSARFLDATGHAIGASEVRAVPTRSEGEWTPVRVEVRGDYPDAAFLQIDLELVQPVLFRAAQLGEHEVWPEDVHATAWFDSVSIVQLARMELTTASVGNIVQAPERAQLEVFLQDLTGDGLDYQLVVQDAWARTVYSTSAQVGTGTERVQVHPDLPGQGWYRASLIVSSGGAEIGNRFVDFVVVPPPVGGGGLEQGGDAGAPDPRTLRADFTLMLTTLPVPMRVAVERALRGLGLWDIELPAVVDGRGGRESEDALGVLGDLLARLLHDGVRVGVGVDRVPLESSHRLGLGDEDVLGWLSGDESAWRGALYPLLDKFGQRVRRWRVLSPGSDRGARGGGRATEMSRIADALARLVPGPTVHAGWAAHSIPSAGVLRSLGGLSVEIPAALGTGGVEELLGSWGALLAGLAAEERPSLDVVLPTVDDDELPIERAARIVRQGVTARLVLDSLSLSEARLALSDPHRLGGTPRAQMMPGPEYAAFRTMIDVLAGRSALPGPLVAPGVRSVLLVPDPGSSARGGALVLWNESAEPEDAILRADLGQTPVTLVDVFGNRRVIEPLRGVQQGADGRFDPMRIEGMHVIPIGHEPIIVEGIDTPIVQFAASVVMSPEVLAPVDTVQTVALSWTNPFTNRIDARIYVLEPGGLSDQNQARDRSWTITPRGSVFSAMPGETVSAPISVAFSPLEPAGAKRVVMDADLEIDGVKRRVRIENRIRVDVATFDVSLSYRVEGGVLMVEAFVTNLTDRPLSLRVRSIPPSGFGRSMAPISELPPFSQGVRRFPLRGDLSLLRGQSVVVSVEDMDSRERINSSILIDLPGGAQASAGASR